VKPVLQTLAPNESYYPNETASGGDESLSLRNFLDIFKRRFFYFLLPFGLVSILGLYFAAIQKPSYISEGKILVESQVIAPDLVRPITTATASERIQLIQQRVLTRDNLLSIANKFGLFPQSSGTVELMRKRAQIKPADIEGQPRQGSLGSSAIAFTVGFEYGSPELAMRVANEFVTLIVNEDARSRTSRATEAVKILTGETKDIEDKLESTQMQITEIARRPREAIPDTPDQQKSQLTAFATLKAELVQKASVYSEAHPAVIALRKRVAAMEKTLTQPALPVTKAQSTQAEDIEALKRQRDAYEKRLADANTRLATARLSEKMDRDQQFERLQVIELPQLPQKPEKSGRLKIVGIGFAAALALGFGIVIAAEFLDGSIRGRHQLSGVIASPLIVSIPYIEIRSDITRARLKVMFGIVSIIILLAVLGGLTAAIVLGLPIDFSWFDEAIFGYHAANQ
jgi:uncharacterized protein involved in exopolysaccharide biosynthesis